MGRTLATAAAVVAWTTFASAQTPMPAAPPAVVTRGEATVKHAPDRAWITVSTEVRDGKAAEARRKSAEIMTNVLAALKRTGLASDAIRTTGYSLTPEMDWTSGRAVLRGYVVRNQVEVRVDDIDKLGDVLDAANAPKDAGLSVVGPRFDLKNRAAAEQEALALAVDAAMARARAMATGAKRTLGAILRVEDDTPPPSMPRPMMANRAGDAMMAESAQTPITPGEIEIRAQVVVTVALQPQ